MTIAVVMCLLGLTGLGDVAPAIPILGLSILGWFLAELLIFAIRFRRNLPQIEIVREIRQGDRSVATAWAKSPCMIRVMVTNRGTMSWPLVFMKDRVPEGRKVRSGSPKRVAELRPDVPVVIEYELRSTSAGMYRFEGVELRVADLAGMFYRRVFLRSPMDVLILPPLTDDEGKQRADKRFNSLPPPGLHRLRRPGGGSELLDLRDYRPGDPPKMIAWKPSAKKDKLITKEYESDVPVRVMLFVDQSESVRIGPAGETPIGMLSETASGIAQAAAATRDLVGLTRFDEHSSDVLAPARTNVHTIRLLGRLAEAAAKMPNPGPRDVEELQEVAYPLAQELYPELFDKDYNTRPWGLFWIPLMDTRWGWLFAVPVFIWMALIYFQFFWVVNFTFNVVRIVRPRTGNLWVDVPLFFGTVFLVFFLPFTVFLLVWFFNGIRGLFPRPARRTRKRKQLAAIFTTIDRDSPGRIERYLRDDEFLAERIGRFLADHHVRIPPKLYDHLGQYRYRCERKAEVLATAIVHSVARARDNELYVILADLNDLGESIAPLLKAIRVARGRHHHVMVIVPWPVDVPPPGHSAPNRPVAEPVTRSYQPGRFVHIALTRGYQQRFEALHAELARIGVIVVRAQVDDPIRLVLDRIDRIRGMRARR